MKCITKLGLDKIYIRDHQFNHNFLAFLNKIYSFVLGIEKTFLDLFFCTNFVNERTTILDTVCNINVEIRNYDDTTISGILLYDEPSLDYIHQ